MKFSVHYKAKYSILINKSNLFKYKLAFYSPSDVKLAKSGKTTNCTNFTAGHNLWFIAFPSAKGYEDVITGLLKGKVIAFLSTCCH